MPIIIFTGGLGQGKTLSMTAYAHRLREKTPGTKLYANYGLLGAIPIRSFNDLLRAEDGILCLDEAHISLDSRNFKDRSSQKMTHWLLQTRKANLIVMMTSQRFNQIDMRARNATDTIVICERLGKVREPRFRLKFIDWNTQKIGRVETIWNPSKFYGLYNTYEKIHAIE